MTIYKFVTDQMYSPLGSGAWTVGRWRSVKGELIPCENGLHAAPVQSLLAFADERLYRVEVGDEYVWHGEGHGRKVVARRMRLVEHIEAWNERTARLFAAACAERVLPIYEREHPDDERPRWAIETARRYAGGEATAKELDTARDAARDAARAAARAAARDAGWEAASSAASSAARAAASSAGCDAARDAAGAAARAAGCDAGWAAARDAAGAADWNAAWDAAWDAECAWQARHLVEVLGLSGEEVAEGVD